MAVENSSKKYLNFDGLSYYDEKLKKWIGDNYAPLAGGADATESMRLWNEFLAGSDKTADGKLQALPTLKSLKDFKIDMVGDGTEGSVGRVGALETKLSDYTAVKSNATAGAEAKTLWGYFLEGINDKNSPAPTLKTIDDELYVTLGATKTSKLNQIVGSVGTSMIPFSDNDSAGLDLVYSTISFDILNKQARKFASAIETVGTDVILRDYGRLGLAEANLSFTMGTLAYFEEHIIGADLERGKQYEWQWGLGNVSTSSQKIGRLGLAEQYIGNINTTLYGVALGTGIDSDANGTGLVYKMEDLYGDPYSEDNDKRLGRVGLLEAKTSDYDAAATWISNNGAKAATAGDFVDTNKAELDRAFVNYSGGIESGNGYLPEAFGTLGTSVLSFYEMMEDYWSLGTDEIRAIANKIGGDDVKSNRSQGQIGRLGLVETNLAWVAEKAISANLSADGAQKDIDDLSKELTGDTSAAQGSDARLGRVGVLEQKISGLTGAVHFKGTVTDLPTLPNDNYVDGDIIVIAGSTAEENKNGKEYILSGGSWVELGDTTQELARIGELEKTINGDGSNAGLVKTVNEIYSNYVKSSDIVFATTAEIDTLFPTTA